MLQVTGYPTLDEGLNYLKSYIFEKESNGEPVIVFCEDRLTLLVEQAVCQAVGGSFSTSVTTFARFLRYSGKILTKQGSVMSVGKILAENASTLKCLSFHGGVKNGATAVYEMLSQLFASKVSGELLLSSLPEDGLLRDKMYDLALIQDEYEKFLTSNNYVDENRYLSMLPTAIRREKNISQTTVLFFGFSSLTAQALDGVRASCESAKNVLGLFPAGNHEIYAKQAATAFKRTCEEYGEVKLSQLKIPENRMDTAYILRSQLYTPEVFSPTHAQVETGNAVQILQVSDQEAELRFVCGRIKKYIEEGGRYSDVTVFLPDVQSYSLLLNKVFGEYGIPYFADLKKSLSTHPFAFFLLSILNAVHDGATPSSVEQIASSCYFGDNGQYRNYLAKFCNYRGGAKREIKEGDVIKDYNREYLISMRERLLTGMGAFSRKMTGKNFCAAVRKIYTQFSVEEVTKHLVETCDDAIQREYLVKMEKSLESVLNEAEWLLGDTLMSASDFSTLLEEGLSACEVSLLPLRQDEVFVGDIAQSRVPSTSLVFALGMTDAIPLQGEDTALLSDKELQKLETVKIKIEPSVAQVNARVRESVCLNLCSFQKYLYLLYPVGVDEERSESEILRYARRIFSDAQPNEDLFIYHCTAPMPALKELLWLKDAYREGLGDYREKYASLYAALRSQPDLKDRAKYLFEEREHSFFMENGEKLFFSEGEVSPTLLENYYTCPYRNFSSMGLKLQEREEGAMLYADSGVFVHAVLEATAKNIENIKDEQACLTFARQTAEELFQKPKFSALKDTSSGAYAGERLSEESAQVALQMYRQIVHSNFKVKAVEYACHLPEERLHGKIDRVDECEQYIRIVDYKTGNIDDTPTSYYVGKKLQLQLYMSAVSEGKIPAGVYYFPASVRYTKEGESPFGMLGFMNGEDEVVRNLDTTLQEGQKSAFFNASLGKNTADKVMSEENFRRFIAYALLSSRQGSKELKQGFIAPTPYDGACRYCAYKGMCAALGQEVVRKVEGKITCKQIADIVQRQAEGEK